MFSFVKEHGEHDVLIINAVCIDAKINYISMELKKTNPIFKKN